MTDPITCPECGGKKEKQIGRLRLTCQFCHGRGTVGGDYEPAEGGHQRSDGYRAPEEGEQYNPDIHGPLPGAGEHPAVKESGYCPQCLGSGKIVNFGSDIYREAARHLVEIPCPTCQGPPDPDDPDCE